jgi:hypothetical protein
VIASSFSLHVESILSDFEAIFSYLWPFYSCYVVIVVYVVSLLKWRARQKRTKQKRASEEECDEGDEASVTKEPSPKRSRTEQTSKKELEKELKLAREAREEERRARKELEQKLARLQKKGKSSSKSSSSCAENKEEDSGSDSSRSDSATVSHRRVSGSGCSSVKARYHQLKEMAEEMATVDENARLKKDNLLMKRAMNGR